MKPITKQTRSDNLERLGNELFDVLVIGGGVTGAGVAVDAAARGYSVALVERTDFASGTSSKSTKLLHGGIRYLPNFDFAQVHEGLVERGLLLQNAPFLAQPLEFVLPIYEGDRHPVGIPFTTPGGIGINQILNVGLSMYDVMAGKRGIKWHRHLKREKVLEMAPQLVQTGLKEGFSYFDGQTHDARLTFTLIRTAAQYGAAVTNYTEVTSFTKDADRVNGAIVKDRVSGQEITVRARHVVNATGIYAEQIEGLSGYEPQASVEPSKGVHLILSKEDVKIGNAALVLPETEDKRILFIVPWGSRVILGTTDTGTGDLDHPRATKEDITYLLSYINRYLGLHLTEKDIISTYAGYRPLVKPRSSNSSTAKLSRSHSVLEGASGIVTIVGGKLTTYRRMAQDTVDVLSRRDATKPVHATESLPLHGSAGWGRVQLELARRGSELGLTTEITEHLGQRYGAEAQTILAMVTEDSSLGTQLIADLPYIKAEIVYAYRNEMALTPEDVLARRTSITLEDRQRGLGILEEVAALMANDLHWSTTQQQQLIAEYRDNIQQQIAVEQGQEPTVMTQVSNGGTR